MIGAGANFLFDLLFGYSLVWVCQLLAPLAPMTSVVGSFLFLLELPVLLGFAIISCAWMWAPELQVAAIEDQATADPENDEDTATLELEESKEGAVGVGSPKSAGGVADLDFSMTTIDSESADCGPGVDPETSVSDEVTDPESAVSGELIDPEPSESGALIEPEASESAWHILPRREAPLRSDAWGALVRDFGGSAQSGQI